MPNILNNPLEQFNIVIIATLYKNLSITNFTFILILNFILVLLFIGSSTNSTFVLNNLLFLTSSLSIEQRFSKKDICVCSREQRETEICNLFNSDAALIKFLITEIFRGEVGKFYVLLKGVNRTKSDISDEFFNSFQSRKSTGSIILLQASLTVLLENLPQLAVALFQLRVLCVPSLTTGKCLPLTRAYFPMEDVFFLLRTLKMYKEDLLNYIFLGANPQNVPKIIVISSSELNKLAFIVIKDLIQFVLIHYEFQVTTAGTTIKLGPWLTIKRKGGGGYDLKAINDLVFKINTQKLLNDVFEYKIVSEIETW